MITTKEKEPAPEATGTSSANNNYAYLNDSTYRKACQAALQKTDEAIKSILAMYESMSDAEQRAFDLGETYHTMIDVFNELEEVIVEEEKHE